MRELEIGQAKLRTFEKLVGQKFSLNLCLRILQKKKKKKIVPKGKKLFVVDSVTTYKTLDVSVDI